MAEQIRPIVGSEIFIVNEDGRVVYEGEVLPEGTPGTVTITWSPSGHFTISVPDDELHETLPSDAEPE